MVTDVNTDTDELLAKKRRRITAAKCLSSSDSEEEDAFAEFLPAFPRQPIVRQQSCENNSSLSAYYNKGDTSYDASFKKYIIKALTDIKYKVNIIIANQNDERDTCTTCKKNQASDENEERENPFISMFPIKNDEDLQTLERFLMDEQNRAKLIKQLHKLGGQSIKHTVQNMMKKCFAFELAQTFSWFGRRNKKQFSELRFCTIVIDVVQKHYPDATNTFICTFIKEWLRRAPEKCGKHVEVAAAELRTNIDDEG
ncbi:hypothetical protein ACS0PU_011382 [Formica fusca]